MAGTLVEWEERFWRFDRARMSVSSFCEVEEVSVASFYRWRKKLADTSRAVESETDDLSSFQRVELLPLGSGVEIDSSTRATKIRISGGVDIELGADVDVERVLVGIVRMVAEPTSSADRSAAVANIESRAGGV